MDNSIYEVEREDYKAFIGQLNKEKTHIEEMQIGSLNIIKVISDKTKTHLCSRVQDNEFENEHYFIFNYPDDDERIAATPVFQLKLDTKEEVQSFVNLVSKLQKEKKDD